MARRPRSQAKRPQSNLVTALAVFVVLFVFSFGAAIYAYTNWHDLNHRINGNYDKQKNGPSRFEALQIVGDDYEGYIAKLEKMEEERKKDIGENENFKRIIGANLIDQLDADIRGQVEQAFQNTGTADPLLVIIRRIHEKNKELKETAEIAQEAQKKAETSFAQTKKDWDEEAGKLNDMVKDLKKQIEDRQQRADKTKADLEADLAKLCTSVIDIQQAQEKEREQYKKDLQLTRRERDRFSKALEDVQNAKIGSSVYNVDFAEEDGRVLEVNNAQKFCIVDIGQKDGAKPGMQFIVYETGPSGKRREKAKIEIKKVYDNFSHAGIESLKDELEPILKGDSIISPLFRRGQPNIFVLEKDIDVADRNTLVRKIEKFGNKVAEAVSAETDFVVIKLSPGPMAQEAQRWAVRVIRMNDIARVLGED